MIKKRYITVFIILAVIVMGSSWYSYHKNYTLQVKDYVETLDTLGESAKFQYDATFFQICFDVEKTIGDLKEIGLRADDFNHDKLKDTLRVNTEESYFITDMVLVTDKKTYVSSHDQLNVNINGLDKHFESQEEVLCVGLLESRVDKNVFYAINVIKDIDGTNRVFLIGIDYNKINKVTKPSSYNAVHSYIFLLSSDGYFLYHPDRDLMGKNVFDDKSMVVHESRITSDGYDKITDILLKKNKKVKKYYFNYKAYGQDKIAYANRLDDFNGVVFITSDYGTIDVLKGLGVEYGQGYYFEKPGSEIV